jgi:hypothetical protein
MSIYISLLSTLDLEECISRLEEAGKQETIDQSGIYHPLRCEVTRSNAAKTISSFLLRKRKNSKAMFVIGQLYEVEKEGTYKTLITYAVGDPHVPNDLDDETNDRLDKVNRNIGIFLSLILCFVTGFFLGVKNFPASIMAASLLVVILISLLGTHYIKRQRNKDVVEMVNFLKKTLEAQ